MSPLGEGMPASAAVIDPEHPWLGLFSYSEETLAYFHGREEETGELCRRVQRKPLTVLFGQSGLGKTSLLRAGVVPRLRKEGYCPVYVRVDYAPESPAPSEQIKQAIFRATAESAHWTRPGSAIEGESLWEFLHHRGDLLRDASGKTLIPLLIFDQFEEVFTLGQADEAGRRRAAQYLEDLAGLVENRAPAALEARIETDDSVAEAFDFARADYRVLIALREDYLAHLEGVKGQMPSITQNRMRLARMTGAQALAAVTGPGGRLVSQEVAESIVRFVAGGSELANAEIEPSLLSLVCRELNNTRVAQGRAEISADLLAGSRDTILTEFYERALADQPAGVRRVIEDDLLTDSGHRESLAQERVAKALAAAGAAPDALAKLVDRRLLRVEDRLDMRRVELTHDVLCSVVVASRNLRHEREARDAAERMLAEQREREAATHRTLVRTRAIAVGCAVMMVIAIAGAVFGWVNLQRARAADEAAQRARGDAEKLIGFLIEDFYNELEPTGRLDTLGKLAHMTVGYYDGLPKELMTPRTQTYRAMALVREGAALNARGDAEAGFKKFAEAQGVFEQLRAAGDTDPDVTYGLALVLYSQGATTLGGGGRGTPEQLQQAADLLRPIVAQKDSPAATRILFANALNVGSHFKPKEEGVKQCEEALAALVPLGALELKDLSAASAYADTADSQARHLLSLGRSDEAQKLEEQVYELTEKLLLLRPNDLHALADRYYAGDMLSILAQRRFDFPTAVEYAKRSVQGGEDYVRFDPSDLTSWGYWIRGLNNVADVEFERGDLDAALGALRAATALAQDPRRPSSLGPLLWPTWYRISVMEGERGQHAAAEQAIQEGARATGEAITRFTAGDSRRQAFVLFESFWRARLRLADRDYKGAVESFTALIERFDRIEIPDGDTNGRRNMNRTMRGTHAAATSAALAAERGAEAEAQARRWLAVPPDPSSEDAGRDDTARGNIALALALAMQGRLEEARSALAPGFEHFDAQAKAGGVGVTFVRDYGTALYVSALVQGTDAAARSQREAALAEAARLIATLPAEVRQLAQARWLSEKVAAARGSTPG